MKHGLNFRLAALALLLGITACADNQLVGEWKVNSLEIVQPGQQAVRVQHIGTYTFNSDGTGRRDIRYSVLGQPFEDQRGFRWSVRDKYLTLESDSAANKVWIMEEDGRFRQRWKSTDGGGQVQTLELAK